MRLSEHTRATAQRRRRCASIRGTALIVWWQFLQRNLGRDLALTVATQAGLLTAAAALQRLWPDASVYSSERVGFLERWFVAQAIVAAIALLPYAAVAGAQIVPGADEFAPTQATLLTDVTALDLVLGRLIARLWPITCAALLSCAFWLSVQLGWHFLSGAVHGFGPIASVHLILLSGIAMLGAVGFLFAIRRRPGRRLARGALTALGWFALCLLGILLINPVIAHMNAPERLIELTLLFNPVTAVSAACGPDIDILRAPVIYDRLNAPEYQFFYPSPLASSATYLLIACAALAIAAVRLRRAYQ